MSGCSDTSYNDTPLLGIVLSMVIFRSLGSPSNEPPSCALVVKLNIEGLIMLSQNLVGRAIILKLHCPLCKATIVYCANECGTYISI